MAGTVRGRELTDQQRRDQLAIRARMLADIIELWQLLDPEQPAETTASWLGQAVPAVLRYRSESARSAATYYDAFRHAETGARDFRAKPAEDTAATRARLTASLLVTGPTEIRKRVAAGQEPHEAARAALVMVSGATGRHTLDGGRDTVVAAAKTDRRAIGYARVTGDDPCWFCAMLASRGPDYKTAASAGAGRNRSRSGEEFAGSGSARFHDHCACSIEPVFRRDAAWPGSGREFEQLWKDSTKGKAGVAAVSAFRAAIAERSRTMREQDETPEPAQPPTVVVDEVVDEPSGPVPVAVDDLSTLSEAALENAFADATEAEDAEQLDAVLAEMNRRHVDGDPGEQPVDDEGQEPEEEPAPDPGTEVDPEQAAQWERYEQLVSEGYSDEEAFAEAFNRDAEQLRRDEVIAKLRAEGYQGRNLEALTRAAWRDEVYRRYLEAEQDTRGHMLTRQAQSRGVDPLSLFTGPAHVARANASDELKEWWDGNGRPTYEQWVDMLLGKVIAFGGTAGDGWLR
ncbi:hypothetical protein [Saccharothrix lopnurensis]|uniref:Capsid maturation protease n=1 Tax=Saccharothrix lopnurensis TaxID=1670621 RepID=A0ABW1P7Z4_9PSEU